VKLGFRLALLVVGLVSSVSTASGQENPHLREGQPRGVQAEEREAPPESSESHGNTVVKSKGEVSAYTDSDSVSVFTPALQGSIENPVSGWSANGSYLVDVVSAASVDIVSTASRHWTEVRHAAEIGGTYKPNTVGATVAGSVSREPDYLSLTGGGVLTMELAHKTANPTFAYSYGHDTAGRSGTPFSVFSHELVRHTMTGALELILDPFTLLSFSVDGIFEIGDQSKPYRFLPMFDAATAPQIPHGASVDFVNRRRLPGRVGERLPGTRNRFAVSGRIAQRLSGSTLVLSERLYTDDWGLKASTTDLRFVIDLSKRVLVWTHLRGHFQSGVSFWRRAYVAALSPDGPMSLPKLRTGDREQSPLEGGTFGAGLRWDVGSAARPHSFSLVSQVDVLTTEFNDALFIQSREGILGVLDVEAEF
jgi:hypothetical protein